MKGQDHRPTTGKKPIASPKLPHKQSVTQKVKTEQKEIDPDELIRLIQQTIAKQKECESNGKYVEADAFKRKAKMLREQLQNQEMDNIRIRHQRELQQLQEAHLAEMNLFELDWSKQICQFNKEIDRMLAELAERHERQLKQAEGDGETQKKFKESPKLLELRKVEQELGKQQNYMEAHRVQLKANKLEKQEYQKHSKTNNKKIKLNLEQLRLKQNGEVQALRQRIQRQVEENEIERIKQEGKLRQKYENILKETEFMQNKELIYLKKTVKLNQLQKKSRVGGFGLSKDA